MSYHIFILESRWIEQPLLATMVERIQFPEGLGLTINCFFLA